MAKPVHINTSAAPESARSVAAQAMSDRGFQVSWVDPWSAVGIHGNQGQAVLLRENTGIYVRAELHVTTFPGGCTVTLRRTSKAWGTNGNGLARAKRLMRTLVDDIGRTLAAHGHHVDVAG